MARLSTQITKQLEQARSRLVKVKDKHDIERSAMQAAEDHAQAHIEFLENTLRASLELEGAGKS